MSDDDNKVRAEAQWVSIIITNYGSVPVKIKGMYLSWGKLYIDDDTDNEVGTSYYENSIIQPGANVKISSSGRSDASSGTEGGFNLVDPTKGDQLIRSFYWECPWGSKTNTWTVGGSNSAWMVETDGAHIDDGALGNITVSLINRPY